MVKLTLDIIKKRLDIINPNIDILSELYHLSDTKMKCYCKICNYEWMVNWESLQQGSGCPFCAKNMPINIDDLKASLYEINKNIEVLRPIKKNGKNQFVVRCLIDNHEWTNTSYGLKSGDGCAKCAGTAKLTIKEVKERLSKLNPKIKLITDSYTNSSTKLDCQCLECDNEWKVNWGDLSQGYGCPECGKKNSGWNKTSWIRKAESSNRFESFKVYMLRCWNEHEEFYKIGITFSSVSSRYMTKKSMPYNYEIVKVIESEDGIYIWNLEKQMHRYHRNYKYIPKIYFDGCRVECFSKLIIEVGDL